MIIVIKGNESNNDDNDNNDDHKNHNNNYNNDIDDNDTDDEYNLDLSQFQENLTNLINLTDAFPFIKY